MPLQRVGRDRFQQVDRLPLGQRRGGVLLDAGGLDGGDVLGGHPGDQPLGGELLVGAAQDGEPPGHGGRLQAGFEQGPLVELDVVGGDLQRIDALGLHVAEEVGEVAAVGLDRVVGQQHVADPGDQGPGRGRRRGRLRKRPGPRTGRPRPCRRRGVAVEEVAPLGDEGAGRRYRYQSLARSRRKHRRRRLPPPAAGAVLDSGRLSGVGGSSAMMGCPLPRER